MCVIERGIYYVHLKCAGAHLVSWKMVQKGKHTHTHTHTGKDASGATDYSFRVLSVLFFEELLQNYKDISTHFQTYSAHTIV